MRTKREQQLLWLLLIAVLVFVPFSVFDRLVGPRAETLAEVTERVQQARERAQVVREAQDKLREAEAAATVPPARLLGDLPFDDMERELRLVAAASGVSIERLSLTRGEVLEAVPWLRQYQADVEVRGSYAQFVAFLRALEEHPLLVEIPDLILQLPSDGLDEFSASLELHFFRQAEAQPAGGEAGSAEGEAGSPAD